MREIRIRGKARRITREALTKEEPVTLCKLCSEGFFCDLPKSVMEAFQPLKFTVAYPAGATLFVEGQACRG
jgi:hypothetical protein